MATTFTEVIANTTVWVEATAVRLDTPLLFSLTETTGGGTTQGTIAIGTYTKTTFAQAFTGALLAASANSYIYLVSSDQVNYLGIPNTTPTKWGSSFTVSFTGAGAFFVTIP